MTSRVTRRTFLGSVAGGALLAGCVEGHPRQSSAEIPSTPTVGPIKNGSPSIGVNATLTPAPVEGYPPTTDETLPLPLSRDVLRENALSGGPPRDGIPSIDEPSFVSRDAADEFLDPGDVVFGVVGEGIAKAYPQSILVSHEIVNDVVAGYPASVTYCPLTGTPMGFWRGQTEFGVSGRLINSNLVMYDRTTDTWWPQMLATAIPGPWNETPPAASLYEFRVIWTRWGLWRDRFPDTAVLSRETGFARNYDRDPYGTYNPRSGYYESDGTMFEPLHRHDRFHNKRMVLGVRTPDGAACFLKDALRDQELMTGTIAGEPLLAAYDRGLDTAYVYHNQDEASFHYEDGAVVDSDGTAHPPDGLPLDHVLAYDAMWFAWIGYYPETEIYE